MSFAGDVNAFAKRAQVDADRFRRAVCLKLFSAVILDTPVRTGRLRGSWNTSVGSIDTNISEPSSGAGAAAISRIESNLGTIKDEVFLHNPVEYAGFVEFGTPRMSGRFMVGRNIRRIRSLMQRRGL